MVPRQNKKEAYLFWSPRWTPRGKCYFLPLLIQTLREFQCLFFVTTGLGRKKDLFLETISTHSKDGVRGPWPTKIIQYKNKWLPGIIFVLSREESEASIDRMRKQGLQSKIWRWNLRTLLKWKPKFKFKSTCQCCGKNSMNNSNFKIFYSSI